VPDIAMCARASCPAAEHCYRHRAIPSGDNQAWLCADATAEVESGAQACSFFQRILKGDKLRPYRKDDDAGNE
jgi:hypothetical protein